MELKKEVIVLGISRYDFVNDEGQKVAGTTVHYYDIEGVNEDNKQGMIPAKANQPYEAFEVLKQHKFPIKANAVITIDLAKGKLKVGGFEFLPPKQ